MCEIKIFNLFLLNFKWKTSQMCCAYTRNSEIDKPICVRADVNLFPVISIVIYSG